MHKVVPVACVFCTPNVNSPQFQSWKPLRKPPDLISMESSIYSQTESLNVVRRLFSARVIDLFCEEFSRQISVQTFQICSFCNECWSCGILLSAFCVVNYGTHWKECPGKQRIACLYSKHSVERILYLLYYTIFKFFTFPQVQWRRETQFFCVSSKTLKGTSETANGRSNMENFIVHLI